MSELKNILSETAGYRSKLKDETREVVSKWNKYGLLEGLESDYDVHGTAILLENQARQLVTEASSTGTADGSEEWSGVALPLVRRIFSEIAAKDFVSVQPMNLPSGLVFYIDFKYGTAQPGFTTGAGKDSQTDSVYGVTNTTGDPTGGLYGAGRYGYSINDVSSSALSVAALGTGVVVASGSGIDYNFNSQFSSSVALGNIYTVTVGSASMKNNPTGTAFDPLGARAFNIEATGIVTYFPEFTKVNAGDASVQFLVSGSALDGASDYVVKYHNQPTDITRGDFEDAGTHQEAATNLDIPEINVELRSEPIVAKSRKLKTIWTPEFAQDLNAYHSIDAEAELTSMLSEYITQEIDLEILDMLQSSAITTDYWSTTIGRVWNAGTGDFVEDASVAAQAYQQATWFQTLGTKVQKVSNKIHQKTMRGGANFMVVSPDVATIFESMNGFAADTDGDMFDFPFGVQKVGTYKSRMRIYKNPYFLQNVMLMGYRGNQFLETGAVYAPYIPLIMTPLIYDPENFTPRKGVMTRYAKKVTRPEFYGKIIIEGLDDL